MPKSFKEMLEGTTEQAAQLEIVERNQKLQHEQQLEWKREEDARTDKQHKQQCRMVALDRAGKGWDGFDSTAILKEADKIYKWLVKTP